MASTKSNYRENATSCVQDMIAACTKRPIAIQSVVLGILTIAVIVLLIMVIVLYTRTTSNPLTSRPFSAVAMTGHLAGGYNYAAPDPKSNVFLVDNKDILRYGSGVTDLNGRFIAKSQAVHVFSLSFLKSASEKVDTVSLNVNGGTVYTFLVGAEQGSYAFTYSIFMRRGDNLTVHYRTGPPAGVSSTVDTLTGLQAQGTTMTVLVLPEQEPTKKNYNPSLPYVQWKGMGL